MKTYASYSYACLLLMMCLLQSCQQAPLNIKIVPGSPSDPSVYYGLKRLEALTEEGRIALVENKNKADYLIKIAIDSLTLDPEAYQIDVEGKQVLVNGGNSTGVMYALLDIREQLLFETNKIQSKKETPAMDFRAIKFNLPWDSYRNGEALQLHHQTCRDTVFWEHFLDMMAENRFNKLTLWNLHPFSYMVKLPKYPEACSLSDEELGEWQTFWHTLFRMAKDRGIETYLVNWNIFVSKEFANAHNVSEISKQDLKHLGEGDTSAIVKDYTRESVRATIDTYPNLTGLGITLGEGMGGMTAEEREKWLLDSYIEGVRQASRKIKFIHRVPLSAGKGSGGSTSASVEMMTRQTLDTLTCFDGAINIELKFNWSHAHATTKLMKVHGGKLTDAYWNPRPKNYYLAWMMRNEDFFMLRWGQPDFIRSHIHENNHAYVNGYYVGSETYIPAKDYITAIPGTTYRYAFERQWMFYKNWGRLLYNPALPDTYFERCFQQRFPEVGSTLFHSQRQVSKVPLIIASFWNARWDFTLYSEGMIGFNNGEPAVKLLSLESMAAKKPMDPTYASIDDFLSGDSSLLACKITPLDLADSIDEFCHQALSDVKAIAVDTNPDLLYEVSDIQAWAYLGLYFSDKLRAAVAYQKFLNSGDTSDHIEAVRWLTKATDQWQLLVDVTAAVYDPVPLMHNTFRKKDDAFHWSIVAKEVKEELDWLKKRNQDQ